MSSPCRPPAQAWRGPIRRWILRARCSTLALGLIGALTVSACALTHHGLSDAGTDRTSPWRDALDAVSEAPDGSQDSDGRDAIEVLDGAETSTCAVGTRCGTACVDTASDVHHCGSCATDCTTLPNVVAGSVRCIAGACDLAASCATNHENCDADPINGCEADLTLATHCGACNVSCAAPTPLCGSSTGSFVCITGCLPPRADQCGTSCVNLVNDAAHCGTCATACVAGPHSTPECVLRTCTLACDPDFADCDGVATNGCEVDLRADAAHCGSCTFACVSGAHATSTCTARACGLACAPGFGDCNTLPADGCEADLGVDAAHCGSCTRSCAVPAGASRTCVTGSCSFACTAGMGDCDGIAANGCESVLASDASHCGVCSNACPGAANGVASCTASVCGIACNPGFVLSDRSCVPAASEACPGTSIPLADGASAVLVGTTAGHTHDATGTCTGGSVADVAYTLTPGASGRLTITLSALYDATFYVRPVCDSTAGEINCTHVGRGVGTATVPVTAGTPVTVWVDGAGPGGTGEYALVVELNTRCGNHALDPGETCDDGNRIAGDGCDASCAVDAPSTDACPGLSPPSIALGNGPVWIVDTTVGAAADLSPGCAGSSGVDRVFTIIPGVSGTLHATVYPTSRWNPQIYVRAVCAGPADLACQDSSSNESPESVSAMVTAGTTYSVIVDGAMGASGSFELLLEIPRCGDRSLQSGETCDDGNVIAGDGCDAGCQVEPRCVAIESESNPSTMPNLVTRACTVFDIQGAIGVVGDQDFFGVSLRAGQVIDARTFVGSVLPGSRANDTVLEVYRGPVTTAPRNNDCGTSNALVCQDDLIVPSDLLSGFAFPVPADGTYVFRVFDYGNNGVIASYGLQLRTQ